MPVHVSLRREGSSRCERTLGSQLLHHPVDVRARILEANGVHGFTLEPAEDSSRHSCLLRAFEEVGAQVQHLTALRSRHELVGPNDVYDLLEIKGVQVVVGV
jgi:hypothetical protein